MKTNHNLYPDGYCRYRIVHELKDGTMEVINSYAQLFDAEWWLSHYIDEYNYELWLMDAEDE